MEIFQALAAFFVYFAVTSAVMQLAFSYSLQVLAEKNELPEFTAFLAWIPMLNLYPWVKVGGGNFKRFVLGTIGATVGFGVLAGGAAAAGFGGLGAGLAAVGFAILAIVYVARIAMATAERRGLSRWLGLLAFVPLANVIAYPYFAFHDGFRAPNKAGLVLGLLLAFGPLPGQIAAVHAISQQVQAASQGNLPGGANLQQAMSGLGTAMELQTRISALQQMDPSDPGQAAQMKGEIAALRSRLADARESLGDEAADPMEKLLAQQEMRLAGAPVPAAPPVVAATAPSAPVTPASPPARPARQRAVPAAVQPPITASIRRDGDRGFPVPISAPCPAGTTLRGAAPPAGTRQWCEKVGQDAGIKHGWMTEYHANGNPAVTGEYRDGLRVGVWTRYYEDGTKRAQAQFEDGMQQGVLISWNPDGSKAYEQVFEAGAPAGPASH